VPEELPGWDTHDVNALAPFGRIRLIAIDVDGTLLKFGTSDVYKTIARLARTLRTPPPIHRCRHRRVFVTLATGRALAGVRSVLKQLPLPRDVPLILYNGSVIVRNGSFDPIHCEAIRFPDLASIIAVAMPLGLPVYVYTYAPRAEAWFSRSESHEHVFGWSAGLRPAVEFNGLAIDWVESAPDRNLEACAVLVDLGNRFPNIDPTQIERRLAALENISVTRSGQSYIEVRPRGSNKGNALERVASRLGFDRDCVVALGDSDNDAEMLRWARIGVTVKGGSAPAADASDFVCRHGAAEGAVELLRLVVQARRYFGQLEVLPKLGRPHDD
jgi:5-amino-6-(5-phospho-D-ribitylamino)uracil phosphatase